MRKLLAITLLCLIVRTGLGQVVPDVIRTVVTPATGANANNRSTVDANLYASKNLRIPRGSAFSLNGSKDSIGYVMFNTTSNRFGVYIGGGNWQTYLIAADIPTTLAWTNITGKPTTLSGYNISDAYTQTQVNTLLSGKANTGDSYTKTQSDTKYYLATNPAGYISSYTETDPTVPSYSKSLTAFSVIKTSTDALYYPLTGNPSNFLTSINSGQIITALGYTPENTANKTATQSTSTTTYPNWLGITNYSAPLTRTISTSGGLTGGGNLGGNLNLSTNATSNNTVSTIVARDASGNFAIGNIQADLINSVNGYQFNDITTPAQDWTLSADGGLVVLKAGAGGSGLNGNVWTANHSTGVMNFNYDANFGGNIKLGSNTTYGKISIGGNYTTMDRHSIDEYSIITPSAGSLGYGVIDVSTTLTGSLANDHFLAYQARQFYTGSGSINGGFGFGGFFYQPTHSGSGSITNARGVYLMGILGTGPVVNDIGIEIRDRTRGSGSNIAIKTGLGKVNFGDQLNVFTNINADAGTALFNTNSGGYGTYIKGGNASNFALRVDNYLGTQAFTVLGNGNTTVFGNLAAANFSGSSAGTNTGDETTSRINSLYGYTPANGANYLPLTAGSGSPLTSSLYARTILPTSDIAYSLGSPSFRFANAYTSSLYVYGASTLSTVTTSAGGYDLLTRNSTTGVVEKVASSSFATATDISNAGRTVVASASTSITIPTLSYPSGEYNLILTGSSLQTVSLPLTISQGVRISITGSGTGGWKIAQNSGGDVIKTTGGTTTSGASGYIQSTAQFNSIIIECVAATLGAGAATYVVQNLQGAPTFN